MISPKKLDPDLQVDANKTLIGLRGRVSFSAKASGADMAWTLDRKSLREGTNGGVAPGTEAGSSG